MHDSTFRLIGAREAATRLLYGDNGIPKGWPDGARAYRNALLELLHAVDEAMPMEKYPINPDAPEEGYDVRVKVASR